MAKTAVVAPLPRGVPQDQAAEESVLGAILAEQGVYERLAGMLEPSDFMDPRHKAIFAAVLAVFDRYEAIDQITIAAELSTQRVGCRRRAARRI